VKLVFIYGGPGVGKLTTAQALAALTGFKLLTIRLASIEAAARARLPGLIFTYVYARPEDDAFVLQVVEAVERPILGGEAREGVRA